MCDLWSHLLGNLLSSYYLPLTFVSHVLGFPWRNKLWLTIIYSFLLPCNLPGVNGLDPNESMRSHLHDSSEPVLASPLQRPYKRLYSRGLTLWSGRNPSPSPTLKLCQLLESPHRKELYVCFVSSSIVYCGGLFRIWDKQRANAEYEANKRIQIFFLWKRFHGEKAVHFGSVLTKLMMFTSASFTL